MVPYRLLAIVFRLTVLCGIANVAAAAGPMDVEYSWVFVDYTFPSPQHRESAVKSGRFIPENCVILDVDVYQGASDQIRYYDATGSTLNYLPKTRVFLTIPRIKPGNPASIAEIVPGNRPDSVLLAPYPNWKTNVVSEDKLNCDNTIVSVFRTKIDILGRFWIVDVGTLDQFEITARSVCPPKILIFDLKNNDKLIKMYKFPPSQVNELSLFTNIEVDIRDPKGRNTFAYIADTTAYKLVVYDFKNDDSWVVDQAYLYPYPNKAHFNINGVKFDLMDGVIGLALDPVINKNRKLFFHSFASTRESWVHTSVLQNKSIFGNGLIDGSGRFFVSSEVRKTQSSVEVMTNNGVLIYASMDNRLVCWNSRDPFAANKLHTVYESDEDFQFPSGMKLINDKVWAVSCQLQNHFTTIAMDRQSVKYRVLVGRVDELIKGTGCDKRTFNNANGDELLVESFEGNMLREWRAPPEMPWSYSRISRVFENKNKQTPRKSLVLTGNINVHNPSSKSTALSYDCRMSLTDGQPNGPDCLGKTMMTTTTIRQKTRIKNGPNPPR